MLGAPVADLKELEHDARYELSPKKVSLEIEETFWGNMADALIGLTDCVFDAPFFPPDPESRAEREIWARKMVATLDDTMFVHDPGRTAFNQYSFFLEEQGYLK